MKLLHILILAILQGLTEFLPISSSGHLVLAESRFKNFQRPGVGLEIFLHMGTLVAILIYFRKEIKNIILAIFNRGKEINDNGRKWALFLILGSVPTAIIGLVFKDLFENAFTSVKAVGVCLMITGLLLWISDRVKTTQKTMAEMGPRDALGIGLIQGLAITPGISRSGSTIAMGIFLGLDRDTAAKFSFLLSIPALFGALLLELKEIWQILNIGLLTYLLGALVSGIVGYFCIILLLKLVIAKRLSPFAYYCWLLGVVALIL